MAASRTRKTATAMAASVIRLWPRFLRMTALCTAGADGGACAAPLAPVAAAGTASTIFDAAMSAAAASTVPYPEPSFLPPFGRYTVLVASTWRIRAELSFGNCALMRATMPATTALAALVLYTWAYRPGPLAAVTPSPAAVSVTYPRWLE